MAPYRIISVGNRTMTSDCAGAKIFDELSQRALPENVDLIDGGLAGLDLIRFITRAQRVVFVDAMSGPVEGDAFIVMDRETAATGASDHYGHSAGLPYLMHVLPEILGNELPEILVVGVRAQANGEAVSLAADKCLSLVLEGLR